MTALTDTSGNVVERYAYTAYGKTTILDGAGAQIATSAYNNPYTFTGRRFDSETGLFYFRARYYDAELGRFIGRDLLGYVDGMSLYAGYFVSGSVDPEGTACQDPCDGKWKVAKIVIWDVYGRKGGGVVNLSKTQIENDVKLVNEVFEQACVKVELVALRGLRLQVHKDTTFELDPKGKPITKNNYNLLPKDIGRIVRASKTGDGKKLYDPSKIVRVFYVNKLSTKNRKSPFGQTFLKKRFDENKGAYINNWGCPVCC